MQDSSPQEHIKSALSGVRVVDLTHLESGPSCTETLAWLGADVVKVEEPKRGDQGRHGSTREPGVDAPYFILLNANKRSIALDLKSEGGKNVLRKLISKADVFIENFGPGVIERLGFGYDAVSALNPRIIYAQIKGFDPAGPYANYVSQDMVAQCMGGAVFATGQAGEPPVRPAPTIGDTGTGLHCVIGIQAALYQRVTTGRGQRIEVAMQEAVISISRGAFSGTLYWGKPPERNGNQSFTGISAPCDLYHCKPFGPNDYVFIYTGRGTNVNWQNLLKVIGRPDLIDDPRFATPGLRLEHVKEVDDLVAAWCRERTKIDAMNILQTQARITAGAVLDTKDLTEDPYLRKRGMFVTIEHPVRGPVTMPTCPIKMSESFVPVRSAPLHGEHTDEILSEWLGMDKVEISELRKEAAVGKK